MCVFIDSILAPILADPRYTPRMGNHIFIAYTLTMYFILHIQVQELSNKAAARFDKANSQHMAAKEMIRMSESQLSNRSREGPDPSSPSPIDLAWQEMLNHATIKVRNTKWRTFMLVYVKIRFCHC